MSTVWLEVRLAGQTAVWLPTGPTAKEYTGY